MASPMMTVTQSQVAAPSAAPRPGDLTGTPPIECTNAPVTAKASQPAAHARIAPSR